VLHVRCEANADGYPTTNAPAIVGRKGLQLTGKGWTRKLEYRLQFQDDGTINPNDPLNDWMECTDAQGKARYPIPRYLDKLLGKAEASNQNSNPGVTRERLEQLGMQVRNRYDV
jgi:hypothetical protein